MAPHYRYTLLSPTRHEPENSAFKSQNATLVLFQIKLIEVDEDGGQYGVHTRTPTCLPVNHNEHPRELGEASRPVAARACHGELPVAL